MLFLGTLLSLALLLAQGIGLRVGDCRLAAVVIGLDLLAFSLLAGFLLGLETCLFGSLGLFLGFPFGFLQSLGLGVTFGEFGGLTLELLGFDSGFLPQGFGFLVGDGLGLGLCLVEFFLLEVAVFLIVLLLQVVEVVLKGAALVQQQVEVVHADDDIVHLSRDVDGLVLLKQRAVVAGFLEVVQPLDYHQSQFAKVHLLNVIVLDLEGVEIVACHLIEQHVAVHAVHRVEENEDLRLVVILGKGGECLFQCLRGGVVAQSRGPQHAAHVAAATLEASSLVELLDNL